VTPLVERGGGMGVKSPVVKRPKCRVCLVELADADQVLCDRCWQRELPLRFELTELGKEERAGGR